MKITVALIQVGGLGEPALEDKRKILDNAAKLIEEAGAQCHPDFIVLTEMFSTPYFCGLHDNRFFQWAEPIPGETTDFLADRARKYRCHIIASFFEKVVPGEYYNSAVIVGPKGEFIKGKLPDGTEMNCYRKNHIPTVVMPDGHLIDEKYYFRPGQGFPIFETPHGLIGCLICYDRSFPESWRSLVYRLINIFTLWFCRKVEFFPAMNDGGFIYFSNAL
jgi:predicted amidohydrolase